MEGAHDRQCEKFGSSGDMGEIQRQLMRFLKHVEKFSRNSGSNVSANAALYRKVLNTYFVMKKSDTDHAAPAVEHDNDEVKPLTKTKQGNLTSCFTMLDSDRKQMVLDTVQSVMSLPISDGSESFDVMALPPPDQHTFYGAVVDEYNKQVEDRVRETAKKRKREEEDEKDARMREKRELAKATKKKRNLSHRLDRYIHRARDKRHRPLSQKEKTEALTYLDALEDKKLVLLGNFLEDLQYSTEEVRDFLNRPASYYSRRLKLAEFNDDDGFLPVKQWGIYDAITVLHGQQISEQCYARTKAIREHAEAMGESIFTEIP